MDLAISLVNYNTKNLVKQCVENITSQNIPYTYEIIITDNGSTDGSVEFIEKELLNVYQNVTLISNSNTGFGAGHNTGLKGIDARYVMIINADIVVLDGAIQHLIDFCVKNPRAGIVAPKLIYPDLSTQRSAHAWPRFITPLYSRTSLGKTLWGMKELKRYTLLEYTYNEPRSVDWLVGACMLIQKDVWDRVGGFDERYFMYCEDIDICKQVWESGYEVWCVPEANMIHFHKRLSASKNLWKSIFDKITRVHMASHVKYFKKWKN